MQKIKLLLLLTLLVVGVSESWGEVDWYFLNISPEGLPIGYSDFSLKNTQLSSNTTLSKPYSNVVQARNSSGNIAELTAATFGDYVTIPEIEGYTASVSFGNWRNYGRYDDNGTYVNYLCNVTITYSPIKTTYRYNVTWDDISGAGFELAGNTLPVGTITRNGNVLTATSSNSSYSPTILGYSNVAMYVHPNKVEGYKTVFSITTNPSGSTYDKTIHISYYRTWNDGVLEYSFYHTQSTRSEEFEQGVMPEGEVSVSLWMNKTKIITDTLNYATPLWMNGTVNETRTLPDDDGDGAGTTAEYKFLGQSNTGVTLEDGRELRNATPNSGQYFYERKHTVAYSDVTEVTIPRTVEGPDGESYDVTAIQKWGFAYTATDINPRYFCSGTDLSWQNISYPNDPEREQQERWATGFVDFGNINNHRNDYLVNVRFESPSQIKRIGDYAFMSNEALKSIIVPSSVENLGQGVWECCQKLTDLRFQTTDITVDGKTVQGVKFNTIKNFTFWYCTALETLVLPEGITTIEGAGVGAPLQYMFALIDLKLPNTLTKIGAHFICCCSSLETLTIPAGVTEIDGACFHGCESLKTVYLLGKASYLAAGSGTEATFGLNTIFCKDQVSGCTFYTTNDYLQSYQDNGTWKLIDENGQYSGTYHGHDCVNGNILTAIQGEEREFVAGKWVTACFPTAIENYKDDDKFGPGAIAAVMIDTDKSGSKTDKAGNTYTYAQGDDPYRYHVSFEEIEGSTIPANTPILLLPGRTYTVPMMPNINMLTEEQKADLTVPRTVSVNASFTDRSETATITMISKYIDHQRLNVGDFYFISSGNKTEEGATEPAVIGSFKKVKDQAKAPYIGAFRCFWQVNIDNVVDVSSKSSLDMMSYFWNDVDGIKNVESRTPEIVIDGVYDLQGRKLNINQTDLPQGLYIVNGKKVVKK